MSAYCDCCGRRVGHDANCERFQPPAPVVRLREVETFPLEREVTSRLLAVIHEYDERLSLVAAVGILEVIKAGLLKGEG